MSIINALLDPSLNYFVNDYNIIAGNQAQAYYELIRDLLDQGTILLQRHFH